MQVSSDEVANRRRAAQSDRYTVLVVDDQTNFLLGISDFLTNSGYLVATATTAELALAALKQRTPDIILSDVLMPGTDGHKFYDIVKQNPEWCDLPFVFLSAATDPDTIRKGKDQGADDFLTKPFNPDELLAVLRGKLRSAKRRKTLTEEKMDVYRKRIIHTLSHEFRTPLVAINTGTELLLDQHNQLETDRVKNLLESVYRGGQRLQRLVNDFMTLQQIDSGRAELTYRNNVRTCSLSTCAEQAIEFFQNGLGEQKAQVLLTLPEHGDGGSQISAYDAQVIEAIHRLMNNAVKFASLDKPIHVSVTCDDTSATVRIRDFGPGVPPEMFEKAVQRFGQINREKLEQQGCGLGLTITNYYIELNGGTMSLQNPAGGGAEFILRFPRSITCR